MHPLLRSALAEPITAEKLESARKARLAQQARATAATTEARVFPRRRRPQSCVRIVLGSRSSP